MLLFLAIFIALYDLHFRWKFKFFYPPLQNSGFNTVFWLSSLLFALAFLQKEICCQGTSGGVDME